MKTERELFEKHNHFQFLMPYVEWDGETYIFKESNSLEDTKNYYNDYLHFIDCWSYWCASASREGYKLVPLKPTMNMCNQLSSNVENAKLIYKAMLGAVE